MRMRSADKIMDGLRMPPSATEAMAKAVPTDVGQVELVRRWREIRATDSPDAASKAGSHSEACERRSPGRRGPELQRQSGAGSLQVRANESAGRCNRLAAC